MKEIQLTKGAVALVDDEDFELVSRYKWFLMDSKKSSNVYAAHKTGNKTIMMHRLILGATDKGLVVDHRDHDGLNNTRSNLRICTHAQNLRNQKSKVGSSRFKGVAFNKQSNKFQSYIQTNGKQKHLGFFTCEIEAAEAYDRNAIKFHGEFACLNFPDKIFSYQT